jgi:hypothetical protein
LSFKSLLSLFKLTALTLLADPEAEDHSEFHSPGVCNNLTPLMLFAVKQFDRTISTIKTDIISL